MHFVMNSWATHLEKMDMAEKKEESRVLPAITCSGGVASIDNNRRETTQRLQCVFRLEIK